MQYRIVNGAVSYNGQTVLDKIDFEIKNREKIAVVGRNGCGKTTLLKAITGEVELEAGTGEEPFGVYRVGSPVIGQLKQITFSDENATMESELTAAFAPLIATERKLAALLGEIERGERADAVEEYKLLRERFELAGGLTYKKEYLTMAKKFGFGDELQKRIGEFSGGQRTKIAFMKLLLTRPDILLLDEPTNHLDADTVRWLEGYLKNYRSAVVVVSHDRMFIDRVADKVYEIEYGETRAYKGNYSAFEKLKAAAVEKQRKDRELQQAEIARIKQFIERFCYKATKARAVQSRIKQLERMKIINDPHAYDERTFRAELQPLRRSADETLGANTLTFGYDRPLGTLSFTLRRGQKLGVIGPNGCGKSALLKTLAGKIEPLSGDFRLGSDTDIGYFDQQTAQSSVALSVFDAFSGEFPRLSQTEARSALAAFGFIGDDVFKRVADLSGGEKVAFALCKLIRRRPNLLLLDEPTNHVDIIGRKTLEDLLSAYEGTVIFVSHDRYFTARLADRLIAFENGRPELYDCGYTEYERILNEKETDGFLREAQSGGDLKKNPTQAENAEAFKASSSDRRTRSPLKEQTKRLRRIQKLEALIDELDGKLAQLNEELASPEVYSDYIRINELQAQIDALKTEQNAYVDEWTTLMEAE